MTKLVKFTIQLLAVWVFGAMFAGPAAADSVSDFYRGKTVTMIVGSGAGGGFGLNGRLAGKHFGKHIPGNPTVVVQFMRGGGGTKAANYVYNVSPKDGSVISMPISSIVANQLVRPKGVRFDGTKFFWLGSITSLASVLSVWHTAPVKSLDDAKMTEVVIGTSSVNSSWYRMVKLMTSGATHMDDFFSLRNSPSRCFRFTFG